MKERDLEREMKERERERWGTHPVTYAFCFLRHVQRQPPSHLWQAGEYSRPGAEVPKMSGGGKGGGMHATCMQHAANASFGVLGQQPQWVFAKHSARSAVSAAAASASQLRAAGGYSGSLTGSNLVSLAGSRLPAANPAQHRAQPFPAELDFALGSQLLTWRRNGVLQKRGAGPDSPEGWDIPSQVPTGLRQTLNAPDVCPLLCMPAEKRPGGCAKRHSGILSQGAENPERKIPLLPALRPQGSLGEPDIPHLNGNSRLASRLFFAQPSSHPITPVLQPDYNFHVVHLIQFFSSVWKPMEPTERKTRKRFQREKNPRKSSYLWGKTPLGYVIQLSFKAVGRAQSAEEVNRHSFKLRNRNGVRPTLRLDDAIRGLCGLGAPWCVHLVK
ncbi:lpxK, partial [Ophiophagus hannah]